VNLPNFQLPVPANPPDAGTVIGVLFGQDWIPAILTVLEILRDENVWLSPPSDIIPQIDELMDRMANPVIIQPQLYPPELTVFQADFFYIHGSNPVWNADSTMYLGGFWTQNPAVIDDEWSINVLCGRSQLDLSIYTLKNNLSGIITITTDEGRSKTVDLYSAAAVKNSHQFVNFVIDTVGNHSINFKMHTKNASSAGYAFAISLITYH